MHTFNSDNIAYDWALNDEVVRTLVEQQPWQSITQDAADSACRFAWLMSFAGTDGDYPQLTLMPKTPSIARSFLFLGWHVGDQLGTLL